MARNMENMKRRRVNKTGLTLPGSTAPIDIPTRHRGSVDSSISSMEFSPNVPDSPARNSIGTQTPTDSCFTFDYPSVTDDDGNRSVFEEKHLQTSVNRTTRKNWFPFPGWLRRPTDESLNQRIEPVQGLEGSMLVDDAEAERLSCSLEGVGKQLRMIADEFDRTRAYRRRSKSLVWSKF